MLFALEEIHGTDRPFTLDVSHDLVASTIIMEFMTFSVEKKVNPPVTLFPWREPMSSVFEHAWVMTHENKVIIDGDEMDVTEFNLNLNGIQELFRSWAQSMHLESLVEGVIAVDQTMTVIYMKRMAEIFLNIDESTLVGKNFSLTKQQACEELIQQAQKEGKPVVLIIQPERKQKRYLDAVAVLSHRLGL